MSSVPYLEKNLSRWTLLFPETASRVTSLVNPQVVFFPSDHGALNLKKEQGNQVFFYYSQDPQQEAQAWFNALALDGVYVLYVYGVGLGYYYDAAKEWLKGNEERSLVFLETDPEVLYRLFETECGERLLHDRQVSLYLISFKNEAMTELHSVVLLFSLYDFVVSALKSYLDHYFLAYVELKARIEFMSHMNKFTTMEYSQSGIGFFNNFFHNYIHLASNYLADRLFDKFPKVPAIICGAGPSLDKNVDVLATLQDRALIFAGGTALNALASHRVFPHFLVAIDPNPDQFARLLMGEAYEKPLLYRNRLFHEALAITQGDKLCVSGSGGYDIANWFQEKLNIEKPSVEIDEGHNVLNFSLSVARAMGCDPILFVGVDLAYSQGLSYALGFSNHPLHDRKKHFRTKQIQDELLIRSDIFGQPVQTLWKWVGESLWYAQYAQTHPGILMVNATEGGIGFPGIVNMPLAQAADKYLTKQYDFTSYLHGEIQNSSFPPQVTKPEIKNLMHILKKSLLSCTQHCQDLAESFESLAHSPENQEMKAQIVEKEKLFIQEEGFRALLKVFDQTCSRVYGLDLERLKWDKGLISEREITQKKSGIDAKRYRFLQKTALINVAIIQHILSEEEAEETSIQQWEASDEGKKCLEELRAKHPLPRIKADETYQFENNILILIDPEMGLNYHENFTDPARQLQLHRQERDDVTIEQYTLNGRLHGPSSFYGKEKRLLARSWYLDGNLQGKSWAFHNSGELYALRRFREGRLEGRQEFFYKQGLPRSILSYSKGMIEGEVLLYHSSGKLARRLAFIRGKRTGMERMWNEKGELIIEAEYGDDRPIGTARKWHGNGILAREIHFDRDSRVTSSSDWDRQGKAIEGGSDLRGDFFAQLSNQTNQLTDSLDKVFARLANVLPRLDKRAPQRLSVPEIGISADLFDELTLLRSEMERLHTSHEELHHQTQMDSEAPFESLWQSPSSQKQFEEQIALYSKGMNEQLEMIEKNIQLLQESIKDKEQSKEQDKGQKD